MLTTNAESAAYNVEFIHHDCPLVPIEKRKWRRSVPCVCTPSR